MGIKRGLTVVVGLNPSGCSCASFLKDQGHEVALVDFDEKSELLKDYQSKLKGIEVAVGQRGIDILKKAHRLVLSDEVSIKEAPILAAIEDGLSYMSDLELFLQNVSAPIIAISGNEGLACVATMLKSVLESQGKKVAVIDHKPVLDWVKKSQPDFYILTISGPVLESTHSLKALAAMILNFNPTVPERYDDIDEYTAAAHRIYANCQNAVFNRDDPYSKPRAVPVKNLVAFGLKTLPSYQEDYGVLSGPQGEFIVQGDHALVSLDQLNIDKNFSKICLLATLALAEVIGVPPQVALSMLKK